MTKIVAIGACCMDTLYSLDTYPKEDTKTRATGCKVAGGGPAATGLVAAQKLGIQTAFLGNLADDSGGEFLIKDFEKYGVNTEQINILSGYRSFAATLILSAETASRTCIFDKGNLPPLSLGEKQKEAIRNAEVLMIDGNEMAAAREAASVAKEAGTLVLYDCGGLYEGAETLLELTDIMIPSEEFALGHTGCSSVEDAAKKLYERYHPQVIVITQGKKGGIYFDGKNIFPYPIFPVKVVDSNGSGDVFHGAFAAGICRGFDPLKCCYFASAVAAMKCMGIGARESVPDFETAKLYLKENGYEL